MDYFQDACFLNNHLILYVFACKLTNIISILIKGGIANIAISTAKFIWFYDATQLIFNGAVKRCINILLFLPC